VELSKPGRVSGGTWRTFRPEIAQQFAQDCIARLPGVSSVAIEAKGETGSHPCGPTGRPPQVWGKRALVYAVKEFRYQVSPASFFQTSRFLLPQLVDAVINEATGSLALDLFAGVGLFTLPLARRFASVIGVEANAQAAADLRTNARTQGLTNVRAVAQMASDFLRRYAQAPPDLVVLDPPRSGVGVPALKTLAKLRPKHIHCVSCSPPTLARDLEFLLKRGYHLESIELFDLFPQTYHIESIARLSP
jgi:23S rRNA (uracil1939-C5)-methyltransferase